MDAPNDSNTPPESDLPSRSTEKVVLNLRAAGGAPILRQTYFKLDPHRPFGYVVRFLRKELSQDPSASLFVYVNSAFAPAPDETIGNLYDCFGAEGMLVVNYCLAQAWG